jgi:hypothetical protein
MQCSNCPYNPNSGTPLSRYDTLGDTARRAPWLTESLAPALPGGLVVGERSAPARPAGFVSDVVVPTCYALITGAIAGGLVSTIADAYGGDWWLWLRIGGLVGMAPVWWLRMQAHGNLLWAIETITRRDLDGDGQKGKPQATHFEGEIHDRRKGRSTVWNMTFPGKKPLLRRFAARVADDGRPFAEREAIEVGYPNFEALRDLFLLNGWATWKNKDAHQQGVQLEDPGLQVLELMASTSVDA